MLKCLMKYEWVKLRRDALPVGTEQRIVAVLAWVLHSEMQPLLLPHNGTVQCRMAAANKTK